MKRVATPFYSRGFQYLPNQGLSEEKSTAYPSQTGFRESQGCFDLHTGDTLVSLLCLLPAKQLGYKNQLCEVLVSVRVYWCFSKAS